MPRPCVERIGEPDPAVGCDPEIVRTIERSIFPCRENLHRTVFVPRNQSVVFFGASDESAIGEDSKAVRPLRRFVFDLESAIGPKSHHTILGLIREQQIPTRKAHRAFSECESVGQ